MSAYTPTQKASLLKGSRTVPTDDEFVASISAKIQAIADEHGSVPGVAYVEAAGGAAAACVYGPC